MISEAYIFFLAFQDKLLSEGHYYVFLKEEQRRPSKCFTTLTWGGGTGNGLFQGFPRAFLGLEQAGSLHIYTMEYYSAIKKNSFESVLMRWMKLYRVK